MRLVKNVGESFSKIAGKKAETDSVSGDAISGAIFVVETVHSLHKLILYFCSGLMSSNRILKCWMHT